MSTPGERASQNVEVLSGYLSDIVTSLEDPSHGIPFFSTDSLGYDEIVQKAAYDGPSYATFSEMESHNQTHLVAAIRREVALGRVTRAEMFALAAADAAQERDFLESEKYRTKGIIEQNTRAQRGRT